MSRTLKYTKSVTLFPGSSLYQMTLPPKFVMYFEIQAFDGLGIMNLCTLRITSFELARLLRFHGFETSLLIITIPKYVSLQVLLKCWSTSLNSLLMIKRRRSRMLEGRNYEMVHSWICFLSCIIFIVFSILPMLCSCFVTFCKNEYDWNSKQTDHY